MRNILGKIKYVLLLSVICIVSCRFVGAEIMSTDSCEYNENYEKVVADYNVMSTETDVIEEALDDLSEDSLEEFRDILEVNTENLLNTEILFGIDNSGIGIMSTYLPGERSFDPVLRNQLDDFSKRIYDGISDFVESGKILYGTESGTASVSANSVLVFEYQSSEEAREKLDNGEAIRYFAKDDEHPVNTIEQLMRDTAYLAYAAYRWDHPEIYYLNSDSFKFTYSGQESNTKSTVLTDSKTEEKYLGRVVFTIEVGNEKNGGKTYNGKKVYYDSFINSCYEIKILNKDYSGTDTAKDTKYLYNPEETKNCILKEKSVIDRNKEKVNKYVEKALKELEATGQILTKEERSVAIVKAVNEWVCDNTYYNKYVSAGYTQYYTPKVYEMSSVLSDLLPIDASPKEGLAGKGDVNAPICEGYSKAMKYLLSDYDITAVLIAGYTTKRISVSGDVTYSGNHMWNGVWINNVWYALDTTFNESSYNKNAYTLVGSDTKISGSTYSEKHYPVGTFWGGGVGKVEFPVLSVDSYENNKESETEEPKPNSFFVNGNNVYYYNAKCEKVTGFNVINGNKYYFNPSKEAGEDEYGSLVTGFFNVGKDTYYRDGSNDTLTTFTGISKGYVFLSKQMSRITEECEGYYYFNESTGAMLKGLRTVKLGSGKEARKVSRYFNEDTGKAVSDEIVKIGSNISYINKNYEREKINGFLKYNEDYYYFAGSVNAKKGFVTISLRYHYVDELGAEKVAVRKYKYYFDKSTGRMATGFTIISKKLYYFSEAGELADESENGSRGKMETGIVKLAKNSRDYVEGNTNTFYMLKNGGMYTGGLITATKEFGIKDAQKFEYYFSSKAQVINGNNIRLGEAVGGYLSFNGKELLNASQEYTKITPYHFDENTGARRRIILYFHGGYYGFPIDDIQREVMKSVASYGDADLNFGNNDIIFATMSDDYPLCASSFIADEKRGQSVDMDGKLLSNDSRVIYNPANDYVNYNCSDKSLKGGITGVVSNDINEYGSNLVIKPGIKEYTYIEKSKIPDKEDTTYTVSFNVLNVERNTEVESYVNSRDVYNFENEFVKTEDYTVTYNEAVNSESDGIVNVFDVESYCKAAYKWCIDTYGKENVLLVGASSGAGICTALIQWAKETDKELAADKTVLISPWLDASMAIASKADKKRQGNGVDYATLCYWGKRYTLATNISEHTKDIFEKGYDANENYLVDYAFASPVTISERQNRDYVNLGKLYIYTGTNDPCMNNGYSISKLCKKMSGTGVEYKCYSKEGHGFVFNANDSNARKVISIIANLKASGL